MKAHVFARLIMVSLVTLICVLSGKIQGASPILRRSAPTKVSNFTANYGGGGDNAALIEEMRRMRQAIERLERRVTQLEEQKSKLFAPDAIADATHAAPGLPVGMNSQTWQGPGTSDAVPVTSSTTSNIAVGRQKAVDDRAVLDFLRNTTINVSLDGYYGYNFNRPVGRVNLLRAYDVLSNAFSINQASVIFERAPDVDAGRRFGARIDLQFGQATETLQGNPSNEPRAQVYRNLFQAYGTYIAPLGKGLTIDFGKWASSLGIEGNYTKDQMNYSRAFWFNFLPFYHMGLRTNLKLNDKLAVNYWLVNGTQQTEPFNGYKDQLAGLVIQPHKTISWTVNYYHGQEHPDVTPVPNTGNVPLQPGLSFAPVRPAPDGRLHIVDSYATWQASPKLTFALEGDYVIQRLWRHDQPGQSAAPSHVAGGAAYARYQLTSRLALAGRAEYLSDRGGLFSGATQALKENTVTLDYKLANGFLMRYEWRRDFSNQQYFFTDAPGVLKKEQNTATLGIVFWWGRKEGSW